jgi:hypothetical protein
VVRGEVEKRHVIAYFTRRGEFEILVNPDHVTIHIHETRRLRRSKSA